MKSTLIGLLDRTASKSANSRFIIRLKNDLIAIEEPLKKDLGIISRKALRYVLGEDSIEKNALVNWVNQFLKEMQPRFSDHLYSETPNRATNIKEVKPNIDEQSEYVDGRIILRDNFDKLFEKYPEALVFGEDSGAIGDVNQGLEGLQKKYGEIRIADTGIREATYCRDSIS